MMFHLYGVITWRLDLMRGRRSRTWPMKNREVAWETSAFQGRTGEASHDSRLDLQTGREMAVLRLAMLMMWGQMHEEAIVTLA